jgi:hypothetical protein
MMRVGRAAGDWFFAWQHGENLGHLRGLFALAQAHGLDGGGSVIAIPALNRVPIGLDGGPGIRWMQGVPTNALLDQHKDATATSGHWSFVDLLQANGFATVEPLAKELAQWACHFEALNPMRVVVNHAPTALIAAVALKRHVVQVGTGFTCPPPSMPIFRTWDGGAPPEATTKSSKLNEVLANALRIAGLPPISLEGAFSSPAMLWTVPELDHYVQRSLPVQYFGALSTEAGTECLPWLPDDKFKKVILYAQGTHPSVPEVLRALGRRPDCQVRAYIPGAAIKVHSPSGRFHFSQAPLQLGPLLRDADLLVCPAGVSTASLAMQSGVPVFALPQHAEQYMTATAIERAGVGRVFLGEPSAVSLDDLLAQLLNGRSVTACAQALAQRHVSLDPESTARRMVLAIQAAYEA